ncbi:DUF3644 domain-containing protein [Nocardia brasiliensis]|nr:DUF3644 domain-containing protein [Nocardia brasiliensis]
MHKAWHYLLHAEFHRDGIKYHYIGENGRPIKVDGEPKAWALDDCLKRRYTTNTDPVRLNVELFVKLRNKIEHRYEHGLKIATGGKAQALVINYETELTSAFGEKYSLASQLRFPIFLHALKPGGAAQLGDATANLPRRTQDLITRFESGIDKSQLDDLQYDYRIRLIPMIGSKTSADLAVNFVSLDDLSDDERRIMVESGRTGNVIIRDKQVDVADKDKLLPHQVVELVQDKVPFEFNVSIHTALWKRFNIRPLPGSSKPEDTDPRYCVYHVPTGNHLYTPAWVKRIIEEIGTVEKFHAFFGRDPRLRASPLPATVGHDT